MKSNDEILGESLERIKVLEKELLSVRAALINKNSMWNGATKRALVDRALRAEQRYSDLETEIIRLDDLNRSRLDTCQELRDKLIESEEFSSATICQLQSIISNQDNQLRDMASTIESLKKELITKRIDHEVI